ncbi:MAG TPA: IS1595 family transposase [Caulobacteraceae bacterium]|jgi:transposase-like protein
MAKSVLSAPRFHNEEAAFAYVEKRLWPNGPVCPFCGEGKDRIGALKGKTTRIGLYKCYGCKKPFTVRVGTIFESSHLPMRLWLQAMHLLCSSKKGISTRQLQRTLGVGMKTAWFLSHRIRAAMEQDFSTPIGGAGKVVEADEMFIGKSPKSRKVKGKWTDIQILSLVERGGKTRSVYLDHRTTRAALHEHLDFDSRLVTDGAQHFKNVLHVGQHQSVDHSKKEWSRGDVHIQTTEAFFSVFKRGLVGVYQHMSKRHLQRYLAEFDFRQNNRAKLGIDDVTRTENAIRGMAGKRLTYHAVAG